MPRTYEDLAEAVSDPDELGIIDPHEIAEEQIQTELRRYLNLDDVTDTGSLIGETTNIVRDQVIERHDGKDAGMRKNLKIWVHSSGSIMYQHKHTQTRKKLIDRSEVTDAVRDEINRLKEQDKL